MAFAKPKLGVFHNVLVDFVLFGFLDSDSKFKIGLAVLFGLRVLEIDGILRHTKSVCLHESQVLDFLCTQALVRQRFLNRCSGVVLRISFLWTTFFALWLCQRGS